MWLLGAERARRRSRPYFGTWLVLSVSGFAVEVADAALSRAFAMAKDFQAAMNRHEETSDLTALGRARPGEWVQLRPQTREVLDLALHIAEDSGGLFDPVAASGIRQADWRDVIVKPDGRAGVRRPLSLSLDGIAKGFAADEICAFLKGEGAREAIVDGGGDLAFDCEKVKIVRIRHPHAPWLSGKSVRVRQGAIASSGPYGGMSQLWSPAAQRKWNWSVTVTAKSCAVADAMTKIAALDPASPVLARWDAKIVGLWREEGEL